MSLSAEFFCRTDQHRALLERAARLADSFAESAPEYDREGRFPLPHFDQLRDVGYFRLTVPQVYGGDGGGVYEMVLSQERLARGDGATALAAGWHLYVVGKQATSLTWPEAIRARLFHEAVTEGALINAAASEPATGSPSRGGLPTTQARRLADGSWMLTGHKNFTTLSPILRYFLVSARVAGTEEAGWFLVERGAAGLRIEETWDSLGMRATGSHDLWLEEVHLPADHLLESATDRSGARTDGWNLHIPAVYLGIAQAARDFAVAYAGERRTISGPEAGGGSSVVAGGGHSVGTGDGRSAGTGDGGSAGASDRSQAVAERPHVQRLIGEMELALIPARTLLMELAHRWDTQVEARAELALPIAACKLFVVESALQVVDRAMRVAGGASLAKQLPLERYYRDVRAGLHNPPMEDVVLANLARAALAKR